MKYLIAGDAVKNSDLVIIATPISSFENVLNSIKDNLKAGSILTDTCSVKTGVSKIFEKMNLKNSVCIPGHPVAGIENSGPKQVLLTYLKIGGLYLHLVKK